MYGKKIFLVFSILSISLSAFGWKQSHALNMEGKKTKKEVKESSAECLTVNGYNTPARVDLNGGWNVYGTLSFIYWQPLEDQLDVGTAYDNILPTDNRIIQIDFNYKPGFKIGLGASFDYDDWSLYGVYTYLRGSEDSNFPITQNEILLTTWIFALPSVSGTNLLSPVINEWEFTLDKADLSLARAYYVGKKLIVTPFLGIGSHVLTQSHHTRFTINNANIPDLNDSTINTDSWSVGPRAGVCLNWLLGYDLRLFGTATLNLAFSSNKTWGKGKNSSISTNILNEVKKYNVRDVQEFVVGFGWDRYFSSDRFHFDVSAAYELQKYSHANYMSEYLQTAPNYPNLVKPGDLYFHGLTLSARFDF